jgi:RNA polymerase sigma factor (sigma-70 family)
MRSNFPTWTVLLCQRSEPLTSPEHSYLLSGAARAYPEFRLVQGVTELPGSAAPGLEWPMADWAEAIEGLLAGGLAATDRVVTLITQHLAHIGAYHLRDSWDDLVQEVLISILQSPPGSRAPAAIVRHIQTTTYRKYIDEIRREQGRRRTGDGSGGSVSVGWRRNVPLDEAIAVMGPEEFWDKQLDPGLRHALEALEERKRSVIECRYLLGCTNEEGAARLEIPLGTYKRLLSQGLSELGDSLLPADESDPGSAKDRDGRLKLV